MSSTYLSRHHKRDRQVQFPFVQLRLEYIDNTMLSSSNTESLVLEMSPDELVDLVERLNRVIQDISDYEGGE